MKTPALFLVALIAFSFGCDPDLLTGVRIDARGGSPTGTGSDAEDGRDPRDGGSIDGDGVSPDGATSRPNPGSDAASDGTEAEIFFPTMFVTIDGVRKSFRLSGLYTRNVGDPTTPAGNPSQVNELRIEFTTGFRNLGAEATPGEVMSEVWLRLRSPSVITAGSYACAASATSDTAPSLGVTWSKNHAVISTRADLSTAEVGGSCLASFSILEPSAGGRIRGTFAATVEGGHELRDGVFDVIVPTNTDPTGF